MLLKGECGWASDSCHGVIGEGHRAVSVECAGSRGEMCGWKKLFPGRAKASSREPTLSVGTVASGARELMECSDSCWWPKLGDEALAVVEAGAELIM